MIQTVRFVCIALLLFSASVTAQTRLPKLVYDFSKGHFVDNDYVKNGKVKPMPTGSFAVVEVINVNTFRYKVSISGKSIEYVTQVPSELQTIFRLPKTTATSTTEGQEAVGNAANQMSALKDWADKNMTEKQQTLTTQQNTAPAAMTEAVRDKIATANAKNEDAKRFADVMKRLTEICHAYVSVVSKVTNIKFSRAEMINLSKQDWPNYAAMEEKMPPLLSREQMRKDFGHFTSFYAKAEALYNEAALAAAKVGENEKKIVEGAKENFENGHHKIAEDDYLKLIDDVYTLQEALSIANSFTVTSPPVQIDGDAVAFEVSAVPVKLSDLVGYTPSKVFPVEIPAKGGLKVDFSVGPVFSFGNAAKDDLYYLQPVPGKDSTDLFRRNNNNAVSPGIAAMMHAYRRNGTIFGWGLAFGVGANVENFDNVKASF